MDCAARGRDFQPADEDLQIGFAQTCQDMEPIHEGSHGLHGASSVRAPRVGGLGALYALGI